MVQQKSLDIEPSSLHFTLIDPELKPTPDNPCDDLRCEHLCLLVADGAVCHCDSEYELADDGHTCESKRNNARKKGAGAGNVDPRTGSLSYPVSITAIIVSGACVALLCAFVVFRKPV